MKDRIKATILALATMAVVAAAFASVALATDAGVDEPWTPEMNQPSYWEARFGGECEKTENHSGSVDASQVVVKDGNMVRVYDPAPSQVLGPVNPANGKHFDPPHSWVMTCIQETSSTSSTSTSSTSSTTSTSVVTTTTQPETTTTTNVESTTSTAPTSASTTAPTTPPTELPFTGAWTTLLALLAVGLLGLGSMILYLVKTQP